MSGSPAAASPASAVFDRRFKPSVIARLLGEYVIGQEEAKRTLAVAVYAHYRKLALTDAEIIKSNVLLIGPTGTGKTLMCATLARVLGVPFVTADATTLAQTRYVADEIEAVLERLVDNAGGDVRRAQHGIVFIDEVDKLKLAHAERGGASAESVQHALLKIMEGAPVRLRGGAQLDTSRVLFICGGTFVGLAEIIASQHSFGVVSTTGADSRKIMERLNSHVKPTDLVSYGLIPEFVGRLTTRPARAACAGCSRRWSGRCCLPSPTGRMSSGWSSTRSTTSPGSWPVPAARSRRSAAGPSRCA